MEEEEEERERGGRRQSEGREVYLRDEEKASTKAWKTALRGR